MKGLFNNVALYQTTYLCNSMIHLRALTRDRIESCQRILIARKSKEDLAIEIDCEASKQTYNTKAFADTAVRSYLLRRVAILGRRCW